MGTEAEQPLRALFIPFPSPGHTIPMLNIADLYARRGVAATVLTTPGNEPFVRPTIDQANAALNPPLIPIRLVLIPFPSSVASSLLPDGNENLTLISSAQQPNFHRALMALHGPFGDFIREDRPDCIVSDAMFTWSADIAAALNLPRIAFYGSGIFAHCVNDSLDLHRPHTKVSDDSESFIVDGLPDRIEMTRNEINPLVLKPVLWGMQKAAEEKSDGVIVNSFHALEPGYAELYSKKPGRRAYYVGPLSSPPSSAKDDEKSITAEWLDSKEEGSVMYVSFGSLNEFSADQIREIASGLEGSGKPFLWALRSRGGGDCWNPQVKGKGLVVTGWAPQVAILNHPAVGGFLTHCGWNSVLEGVRAGVPMATFPVEYDQFTNEKLITQVLEIGVSVGSGARADVDGRKAVVVKAEMIEEAVKKVMGHDQEAEARRARARKCAAMAKEAVEEGGSSYADIGRSIDDLLSMRGGVL